jgi:hypothetical protein
MHELVVYSKSTSVQVEIKEWIRQRSIECIEDLLYMYECGVLRYPIHFFIGDKNFKMSRPGSIWMEDKNADYTIRVYFEFNEKLLLT